MSVPQGIHVSVLARRYMVSPRVITNLFYTRQLSDEECPIVRGRRIIPESYVPTIEKVLRQTGVVADK